MQTAVYLGNRSPHAAVDTATPYATFYGQEANLKHLQTIGARTFVHIETHTRKLQP